MATATLRPAVGEELTAAEPAPLAELGPPRTRGAALQIEAAGVTVRVQPSRRSAEVTARWRLRGTPGPLQLEVPSTLRPVNFTVERSPASAPPAADAAYAVVTEDVVPIAEPLGPARERRIDPASGAIYAEAPDRSAAARYAHVLTVELPASGELMLRATAVLSSGFDRKRWRRSNFEQAHALHKRSDVFVYQFAVRGPDGPVAVEAEPNTTAHARLVDGVVYAAAAARRSPPVGLTLGIGPAVSTVAAAVPTTPPTTELLVQGLVRASVDILLPHRDSLALSVEAGSDLSDGHHVGSALVYQLYTPMIPYLPLGGHLDAGASCDLWQSRGPGLGLAAAPSLRCGPRLAASANALFVGLSVGIDLFPLREPDASMPSGSRLATYYRVAILATVGL